MGTFSIWHWLIVLAVVLILFGGGGKLSRLMGDFGTGLKSFKKGMSADDSADAADGDTESEPKAPEIRIRRRRGRRGERTNQQGLSGPRPERAAMFDIGWQELFIVGVLVVIVVGPKDLPKTLRAVMGWVRKARMLAREFQDGRRRRWCARPTSTTSRTR